jgi:uncharacterized protein (TIGR00369 family)
MLRSTMIFLREYGADVTSIERVLAHSGAPCGSVYHHFPGGRTQLIDEAVALAGDLMTGVIDAAMQLELKANYIRAAHTNGQALTATGTVIHSGRRTATAEGKGAGRTKNSASFANDQVENGRSWSRGRDRASCLIARRWAKVKVGGRPRHSADTERRTRPG